MILLDLVRKAPRHLQSSWKRSSGELSHFDEFSMQTTKQRSSRKRHYLVPSEITRMVQVTNTGTPEGYRDSILMVMVYFHALTVAEVTSLLWNQVDFEQERIYFRQPDDSLRSQPLSSMELTALKKLQQESPSPLYIFCTDKGKPLTISYVRKLIEQAGKLAQIEFSATFDMLHNSTAAYFESRGYSGEVIHTYLGIEKKD